MKSKNIKVGHIYYVQFNPVKGKEFDSEHMVVVLKKNVDRSTFVVVPLTSSSVGLGKNKICLGKLSCLPTSLSSRDSYAVYDQVRTVDSTRFHMVIDDTGKRVQVKLPENIFKEILKEVIFDITRDDDDNMVMDILIDVLTELQMRDARNYVYEKLKKTTSINNEVKANIDKSINKLQPSFQKIDSKDLDKIVKSITSKK